MVKPVGCLRSLSRSMTTTTTTARKFFIGGNWKCNPATVAEAKNLLNSISSNEKIKTLNQKRDVVVAVPSLFLLPLQDSLGLSNTVKLSAQDCSMQGLGAYTGETSPKMLFSSGIKYAIVGHSERRTLQSEGDDYVANKMKIGQEHGLIIIGCIGEKLAERENGDTMNVLQRQLKAYCSKIVDWNKLVLAYEPVWAIGTGKTATPEQAQEVHLYLRNWLAENVSKEVAAGLRIIYGGSVTKENCEALGKQKDVDGFLVGGASLKSDFIDICMVNC